MQKFNWYWCEDKIETVKHCSEGFEKKKKKTKRYCFPIVY